MQHSTTNFASLIEKTNEYDSDVSVGSQRPQEGRMPTTGGTKKGEVQPRRGVLVLELKAMIKDLLFSKEGEQEKPLLGCARMTRRQLADKARQLQIPIFENHTRGTLDQDYEGRPLQQSTPKGSDCMGFGKHGAKTYQEVLKMDHECCRWIDQVEDQQSHWKLKRFSSWLKMQRVFQEPILENTITQERISRRIRQLEEEKLFAEKQASKELDERRKTPEQKVASSIAVLQEENLSLKEQVLKLTEQVQLLMTSSQERGVRSSAESSAEWQNPAGKQQ